MRTGNNTKGKRQYWWNRRNKALTTSFFFFFFLNMGIIPQLEFFSSTIRNEERNNKTEHPMNSPSAMQQRHRSILPQIGAGVLLLLSVAVTQITSATTSADDHSHDGRAAPIIGLSPNHDDRADFETSDPFPSASSWWKIAACFDNESNCDDNDDCDEDDDEKRRRLRKLLVSTSSAQLMKQHFDDSDASITSETGSLSEDSGMESIVLHDQPASAFSTSGASCAQSMISSTNVMSLVISFLPCRDAVAFGMTNVTCAASLRAAFPLTPEGFLCVKYAPRAPQLSSAASSVLGLSCPVHDNSTTSTNASAASVSHKGARRSALLSVEEESVRLFFGQLRRENTGDFPRFLCNMLAPDANVRHIEAHTGPDNRGKGCAWVIVASQRDAAELLRFSKRLFLHADSDGTEMVLIAPPTEEGKNSLRAFAEEQCGSTASALKERAKHLPRQPVVVELPSTAPKPAKRPVAAAASPFQTAAAVPIAPSNLPGEASSGRPAYFSRTSQTFQHRRQVYDEASPAVTRYSHNPYGIDVLGAGRMCASPASRTIPGQMW